jgi:hypothetical protein
MPILDLKQLSREEKWRAMEEIWADLCQDDTLESPAWHEEELRKTEQRIREGKEKFTDWEVAKARMRERAAKKS